MPSLLQYTVIAWVIYISGVVTVAYQNFLVVAIGTGLMTALLLFQCRVIHVGRQETWLLVTVLLLLAITLVQFVLSVVSSHIYYGSLKMMLIFLFCLLVCKKIDLLSFSRKFTNIIVFFAFSSCVLYWFNVSIVKSGIFPTVQTDKTTFYVNLFLYCINPAVMHRNCGIFWEPGAFQVFLNLSLLFVLFDKNASKRKAKIIILFITLITTISTTGYCVAALILLSYLLQADWGKRFKIIALVSIAFLVLSSYFLPIIMQSFEYKFGLAGYSLSENVTSRFNPILLDLFIILDHPLGLMGVDYYAEVLSNYSVQYALPYISSSCTLTMVPAVYGILAGVLLLVGLISFGNLFSKKKGTSYLLAVALCVMFSTESFLLYPLYYLICFFALKGGKDHNLLSRQLLPSGGTV